MKIMRNSLTQRLIDGDKDAFEEIFKQYYFSLRSYACRYVPVVIAEDIVQDVFSQLWSIHQQIGKIKSLKAYLFTSTHNTANNYLKHQQVEIKHSQQLWSTLQDIEQLYQAAADMVDSNLLRKQIRTFINRLPEQTKRIFLLSRRYYMKNAEVAEFLDINIKTVEKHITRALQLLREAMNNN